MEEESKCCVVASSLPVLYTELERCITYFYDRWSSVAKSPHLRPVPTDLPEPRLWLIFQIGRNKDSFLEDKFSFSLPLKWALVLGIKHSEKSFVPVAILCLVIQWDMQSMLLREGGAAPALEMWWIAPVCISAFSIVTNGRVKYEFWKV